LVVGAGGLATVALVAVAAMLAALVFAARQSARVSTHALEPAEVPPQALAA
jgi:hypothetical protein